MEEWKLLSFSLERATLWYGDRRLLLGKSTSPLVWFNVEPIVQKKWDGDACLNFDGIVWVALALLTLG